MAIISIYLIIGLIIIGGSMSAVFVGHKSPDVNTRDASAKARGEIEDLVAVRGPIVIMIMLLIGMFGWPYFLYVVYGKVKNG